ncbi:DUF2155 domain-containing protein [Erythrobacteraceae bacterium WH01K]|nr:DUF2155 domain-containing protein [Erythrobacteraceae bacterium WH01K]
MGIARPLFPVLVAALGLAACSDEAPQPGALETEIPDDLQTTDADQDAILSEDGTDAGEDVDETVVSADVARAAEIGSPMEERVATLGLLNKRNNVSQDIELSPGESRRIGNIIIRLSACERTAPWELPRETGAFVQVLVQNAENEDEWARIFSGWLFKQTPSVNVVEHPVYNVWVKDCAMSFPGEEEGSAAASSSSDS